MANAQAKNVVDEETAKRLIQNKLDLIQEIIKFETLATNMEKSTEEGRKQHAANPHQDPEARKAIELQISLNLKAAKTLRKIIDLKKGILLGKSVTKEEEDEVQVQLDDVALQIGQSIKDAFRKHPDVMHPETRTDIEAELKDPKSPLHFTNKKCI